jgi:hypothetical protein
MKYNFMAVLVAFLLLSSPAQAGETYLVLGQGVAHAYQPKNSDGLYYWQDFDHEEHSRNPTFRIGLGTRLTGWLRGEVSYEALGDFNMFAGFGGSDEMHYSPKCCQPTQWGYYRETKRGIAATLLPGLKMTGDSEVFLRFGVIYFQDRVTWRTTSTGPNGNGCACLYNTSVTDRPRETTYALSPVIGLGMRVGNLSLEYTDFPQVRLKGKEIGATSGVSTLMFNLQSKF